MPKIALYKYIVFFIVSLDVLKEPPHLHFTKTKKGRKYSGKIWLQSLEFERTADFKQHELNLVQKLVRKHQKQLIELFYKAEKGNIGKPIKLKSR